MVFRKIKTNISVDLSKIGQGSRKFKKFDIQASTDNLRDNKSIHTSVIENTSHNCDFPVSQTSSILSIE